MQSEIKQTSNYQSKIIKALETAPDKKPLFTEFDDQMIRRFYPRKGSVPLAKALGKTTRQIVSRAYDLGIKKRG